MSSSKPVENHYYYQYKKDIESCDKSFISAVQRCLCNYWYFMPNDLTCWPELCVGPFHCGSPFFVWFGIGFWSITVCGGRSFYFDMKLKSICLSDHPQWVFANHTITLLFLTPVLGMFIVFRFITVLSILITIFVTSFTLLFVRFLLFGITYKQWIIVGFSLYL